MTELRLNRLAERIMVVGTGCILIAAVAAMDEGVRGRLTGVFKGDALLQLTTAGMALQHLVQSVSETVGYQSAENAPLVLFGLAGLALFTFMIRM